MDQESESHAQFWKCRLNRIRFTRTPLRQVEWTVTVEDPGTWERPWTFTILLAEDDEQIYEYACHEASDAVPNILSGAGQTKRKSKSGDVMKRMQNGFVLALALIAALPSAALGQQAAGIAGVVRDTSGGVLPGVTGEAASPVLIEKLRTVTDAEGRYNIIDLLPGLHGDRRTAA